MKFSKRHDKNQETFEEAEQHGKDAVLNLTGNEAREIHEIQTKDKFPVAKGE